MPQALWQGSAVPLASLPEGVAGHKANQNGRVDGVLEAQLPWSFPRERKAGVCPYLWVPQRTCLSLGPHSETRILGDGTHLSVPARTVPGAVCLSYLLVLESLGHRAMPPPPRKQGLRSASRT